MGCPCIHPLGSSPPRVFLRRPPASACHSEGGNRHHRVRRRPRGGIRSRHRYLSAPRHRQRRRSPAGTPPTSHPRPRLWEGNGRGYGARRGAAWHGRTFGAMLGPPRSLGGRLTPLWAAGSTYLLHRLRSPCSHGTEGTPRLLLTAPREQERAPATSRPVGEGACLLAALPGLGAGHQHFAELARPRASGLLGQSFSAALGGLVSPFFNGNSSPSTEEVASID